MRKRSIIVIVVIVLVIGLAHVGYRFHRGYKSVEVAKKKQGYKTPCKDLTSRVLKKGKWICYQVP